jgi:hypothetical protein
MSPRFEFETADLLRQTRDVPEHVQRLRDQIRAGAACSRCGDRATSGIGFSVGAVVSFGKAILEDADTLTRLSDKTGVSVEWLQRFRVVTDDTGDSLDSLSTSVNKLQQNLGKQNPEALHALETLHLNYRALRAMAPEDQFIAIADALRHVADQDEQVALGTALMGRGFAENLATIKKGFDEVKDSQAAMTRDTTAVLDYLGDQWPKVWRHIEGSAGSALVNMLDMSHALRQDLERTAALASEAGARAAIPSLTFGARVPGVPPDLAAIDAAWKDQEVSILKTAKASEEYQRKLEAVNEKIAGAARDIGHLTDAQKKSALVYEAMGLSAEEIGLKLGVSALAVKKFSDATKVTDQYLESLTAHIGAKGIPTFQGLILTWQQMLNTGKGLTVDGLIPMVKGFDDAARAELALKFYTDELTKSHVALQNALAKVIGVMPDLSQHTNQLLREIRQGGPSAIDVFAKSLDSLPDIMIRAFEGGGGLEGALKAFYAGLGRDLFGPDGPWAIEVSKGAKATAIAIQAGLAIASGFTTAGSRGSNIASYAGQGAAIGTMILPGYGTAVGAGVGALVGALKVPEDEKAARDAFNAFKRQVDAMFDTTASGQQRVEAGGDAWKKMLIGVREAYLLTGRTAAEAFHDMEEAAKHTREDVEKLPDDLARINVALQEAAQDQSDLDAAITKYKFTLEELGPAFQKQELTKQALQLENSFRLLVGAGADSHLVLDRMSDDINDFIHMALKTGTEVPAEMQPMLDQMAKAGKLTNYSAESLERQAAIQKELAALKGLDIVDPQAAENVKALTDELDRLQREGTITDLEHSGIKWSQTMTQGFDRVVTALEKVLKALGWVDDAVGGLSTHPIHIPIDFPMPRSIEADVAAMGARVTAAGLVYAAEGAKILRFMPRGTDTVPAMLTPGERVLSVRQTQQLDRTGSLYPSVPLIQAPTPTPINGPVTLHIDQITLTGDDVKDPERVIQIIYENLRTNGKLYQAVTTVALRARRLVA